MLRNNLLTAFRNLKRNKFYTVTNVLGFGISMAICLLVYVLGSHELSFDQFHSKKDRIYRVYQQQLGAEGIYFEGNTPYPLPGVLKTEFEGFDAVAPVHFEPSARIQFDEKDFTVDHVLFVDTSFFDVFDFKVLSGNVKESFKRPFVTLISESFAKTHFDGDPVGKKVNLRTDFEFEIIGVVEDAPTSGHMRYTLIPSLATIQDEAYFEWGLDEWGMTIGGETFVLMGKGNSPQSFKSSIDQMVKKYHGEDPNQNYDYLFQPLTEIHYDTRMNSDLGVPPINKKYLLVLFSVGLFVFIVAAINYVNLATALSAQKGLEVGIRKTLGSDKKQLVGLFFTETVLTTLLALLLGYVLAILSLPFLADFMGKPLAVEYLLKPEIALFSLILLIMMSVLAGIYPAFVLSNFNPIHAIKNKTSVDPNRKFSLREGLMVFQFAITQVLIICSLAVAWQLNYFKNKSLGFDSESIVEVGIPEPDSVRQSRLISLLERIPYVKNASNSLASPTFIDNNISTDMFLTKSGEMASVDISLKLADHRYMETYGLELAAGRWYTEQEANAVPMDLEYDGEVSLVINEIAVKKLGFKHPEDAIGELVTINLNGISGPVVGVVKDFHLRSLHHPIEPAAIISFPYFHYNCGVNVDMKNLEHALSDIEQAFKLTYPEWDFVYEFYDESLAELYANEERTFILSIIFSGLAIVIAAMGLLGMVSFITQRKTKEIGIRKVLGASVDSIVVMITRNFMLLLILGLLMSSPIAWILMSDWLNGFAYHIDFTPLFLIIGGVITVIITVLTTLFQSIRAASVNPVNSLMSE
jgi:ABC-type antimicrobial peptide transport system permease subunit